MYNVMKVLVYWTDVGLSLFLISMGSIFLISFFIDFTNGFIQREDPMQALLWISIAVGMIIWGCWILKKEVLGKENDNDG
jgi:hypothetical protein